MNDWTLVYRTDSNGIPTVGAVATLRDYVLNGADIKLVYQAATGVWWTRYCPSVSARGSGSQVLVAAVFMHAADTEQGGSGLEFATPFAVEHHIYNSTGTRVVVKQGADGSISEPENRVMAMKWYVRDAETQPWFPDQVAIAVESYLADRG